MMSIRPSGLKEAPNEGVMKEVRDRRHFTPPGEEKDSQKKRAVRMA